MDKRVTCWNTKVTEGKFKFSNIDNSQAVIPGAERDVKIEVLSSSYFPWVYHFTKTTIYHFFLGLCRPSFSTICFRNAAHITKTSKLLCSYLLILTSACWKIRKVSFHCIWVSFVNLNPPTTFLSGLILAFQKCVYPFTFSLKAMIWQVYCSSLHASCVIS